MLTFLWWGGVAVAAPLPANLIISPKAEPHYVLLVEKASQQLYVYRFDREYQRVATYPCATGETRGDKRVSGDQKTPEGIYFFTKAIGEENLAPIYGARAFPTNYPNLVDRRRNKRGNGIWVHGTNEALEPLSTKNFKQERFQDAEGRVIALTDVRVTSRGPSTIVVANQNYRAGNYRDYGRKTLHLRQHKGLWVIYREYWQALPDGD